MATHPFLAALALFTLIAVALVIVWQLRSARRAQTRHGERLGDHPIQAKNPPRNMHGIPQDPIDVPVHATVAPHGTGDDTSRSAIPAQPMRAEP